MKVMRTIFVTLRRSVPFSLRLQVAAWYTVAFALLLLLTGAVFYQYLEHALEASVDTDLQLRAQQVTAEAGIAGGTTSLDRLPGFGEPNQPPPPQTVDVNYGMLVRVLDAHGKLLGETPAFRLLPVPAASIAQPLAGIPWQGTVKVQHDQEVRIYSRTMTNHGQTVAVIQVGQSLATLHGLLHQLVAALLAVGFLVLLICATGSYWLAGRSFAPIQRLAETARKIQAGDLHQRVPVPPVRDEMQYLAVTLNAMLTSLDHSFSQQRQFVADASHELRTPVAVIRNKADVTLLQPRSQEEYCSVLHAIRTETVRLSHLISDLLALARGDEGQMRFEYEEVWLDRLVEAVAANAQPLAQERGIQLSLALQPVTLIGDEARLIQVIMNLLENAIRYTNAGGQVHLRLKATPSEAQLIVQDTGIGIAPEHLPHIFERFYRADPSRKRVGEGGNGLGLSIVEWIVRLHHGSIVVKSQVGQGASFTVNLPFLPPCIANPPKTVQEMKIMKSKGRTGQAS